MEIPSFNIDIFAKKATSNNNNNSNINSNIISNQEIIHHIVKKPPIINLSGPPGLFFHFLFKYLENISI